MTLNQKLAIVTVALFLGLSIPTVAYAGNDRDGRGGDFRTEEKSDKKNFFNSVREKAKNAFSGFVKAEILRGTVTAKTDTTLSVEKDGKTYTVNLENNTMLRRHYWGKSDLAEFSVGNIVNVYGKWTDDTKTAINARLVKNISIQKRFGVFFGEVKSLVSGGWVMTTVSGKRQDQTVTVSSETKMENKNGETITQADVQVGHRIRVKGLWDSTNNTVTEVKQVKDFSLPVTSATVTVTPTATPTP